MCVLPWITLCISQTEPYVLLLLRCYLSASLLLQPINNKKKSSLYFTILQGLGEFCHLLSFPHSSLSSFVFLVFLSLRHDSGRSHKKRGRRYHRRLRTMTRAWPGEVEWPAQIEFVRTHLHFTHLSAPFAFRLCPRTRASPVPSWPCS